MMNRIEHFRRLRGLSMDDLADLTNTTASTISKLEKGRMQLTQEWMLRLSQALDVAPGDLIGSPYNGFSDNAEPYSPPPGHYL